MEVKWTPTARDDSAVLLQRRWIPPRARFGAGGDPRVSSTHWPKATLPTFTELDGRPGTFYVRMWSGPPCGNSVPGERCRARSTTSRRVSTGRCSNDSRRWRSSLDAAWSRGLTNLAPVVRHGETDVTAAGRQLGYLPLVGCRLAFARRSNGRCHRLELTDLYRRADPWGS